MFLQNIRLENILSFKDAALELHPLNVLIGPNACGKSNLIRTFGLVKALPKRDGFSRAIAEGGGPSAWINRRTGGVAQIHLVGGCPLAFDYSLSFQTSGQSSEIQSEEYRGVFERRRESFKVWVDTPAKSSMQGKTLPAESVLAEIRHPGAPEIGALTTAFEGIRLYQEFKTGPGTQARTGISSSVLAESLSEDGSNLALVLNELNLRSGLHRVNTCLNQLLDLFSDVAVLTRGGITQLYVREKGVSDPFAATSLSDGTLRLLCLLAVLFDPTPPPLVCIEEPEVGLHPDAIRMLAELLVEASARTQLVVTTHSPALVDALTDQPQAVIVCERDFDGCTQFRRLQKSELQTWLADYSLGELWQKGEIGGNRW